MNEELRLADKLNQTELCQLYNSHELVTFLLDYLQENHIEHPLLSVAVPLENWFNVNPLNKNRIEEMYGKVEFRIFDPLASLTATIHVEGQIGMGLFQAGQVSPFCWCGIEVCRYGLGRKPRYGLKIRQFQANSQTAPDGIKSISAIKWVAFFTKKTEEFVTQLNQSGKIGENVLSFVGIGLSHYVYSSKGNRHKHLDVAKMMNYQPLSGITWDEIESMRNNPLGSISQGVIQVQFIKDIV